MRTAGHIACFTVALSLFAQTSIAADAPPNPATTASSKPTPVKPTAEQTAIIQRYYDQPPDQPSEKIDIHLTGKDGSPNDNFGKVDPHFEQRFRADLQRGKSGPIDLLFLGDSITEGFTGTGKEIWKQYAAMNPADFGIGGDRTEHVLWRIENGELDGISPKVVVLLIGTNNIGLKPEQILAGDTKIVEEIHQKLPNTKLLVLGIFPRGADPASNPIVKATREKVAEVNQGLSKLDDGTKTRYLDIGQKFLNADGTISPEVMPDALHPSAKGYQIWVTAMQPLLDEMMK